MVIEIVKCLTRNCSYFRSFVKKLTYIKVLLSYTLPASWQILEKISEKAGKMS
nr:MAG TPA: hypothetical protein [Caudoviricetes sp.]